MAEALAKIKDNEIHPATTGDADGSLLVTLLEALATGSRLDVGQKGEASYGPTNYIAGDGSPGDHILDDHLGGIDTALGGLAADPHALGGAAHSSATLTELNALVSNATLDDQGSSRPPQTHKDTHKSAGSDPFASTDLLEAVVKRLQVTGPVTLLVGAVADGQYLKRSGAGIVGDVPTAGAHLLGGTSHTADSLANLNNKVTGGDLDFSSASRPPSAHDLDSHGSCTLAELNADITDATLVDTADTRILVQGENDACDGTSGTPSSANKFVTNADTRNTNARTPSGTASGDLSSSYPGPGVAKIQGYPVTGGAPTTRDILQWSGSSWNHVSALVPHYDSGWFAVNYNTLNYVYKAHSLGVLPRQIQLFVSAYSNGSTCYKADYWYSVTGRGCTVRDITASSLRVAVGTDAAGGVIDTYGQGGTRVTLGSGYARVMCWK